MVLTKKTGDPMNEIIFRCLRIDEIAARVFDNFAAHSGTEELAVFWKRMADDERWHVKYWEKLLDYSNRGMVPQLFEFPEKIIAELDRIYPLVADILSKSKMLTDISSHFLAACRLEFYMIHHAFRQLFHFMKDFSDEITPEDNYEKHLEKLMVAMQNFGADKPELVIIGEMLNKFWVENGTLIQLATRDPLTGAMNRNGMWQVLVPLGHLAKRHNHLLGIIMFDVDDFKRINDTIGHPEADKVLRGITAEVNSTLRRSDIVCRSGGDEFVVLLPEVEEGGTGIVAEKIRSSIAGKVFENTRATVSVGFCETNFENVEVEMHINTLIESADAALYQSKKNGKNNISGCKPVQKR